MMPVADETSVAVIIATLRRASGMSQRQLARESGTRQAQISDWESGKLIPSIGKLIPVLSALGHGLAVTWEH